MDGTAGTAVNARIRALPVTDSRDRISGAKNAAPPRSGRGAACLVSEREFLNPDGARM